MQTIYEELKKEGVSFLEVEMNLKEQGYKSIVQTVLQAAIAQYVGWELLKSFKAIYEESYK